MASWRRLRPNERLIALILVYGVVFIDMLGLANLMPIMPFLVGAKPHRQSFSEEDMWGMQSGASISVLNAAYSVPQFISVFLFGKSSDKFGRRPLLLFSLIGGALGYVLQALGIYFTNYTLLVVARVVTGLTGGSRPVAIAYIADWATPDQRPKLMGLLAVCVSIAMQCGAILGGSLGSVDLTMPCFFAGSASFAWLLISYYYVKELKPPEKLSSASAAKGAQAVTSRLKGTFWLVNLTSFVVGFWAMGIMTGITMMLPIKFGYGPNEVGLVMAGGGVMVLLGNPVYMKLIKHMRLPAVSVIGCFIMMSCAALPFGGIHITLAIVAIVMMGPSLALPATSALITVVAPVSKRGSWTGICIAMQSLGRTIGPIVVGIIFDVDYKLSFIVLAALTSIGFFTSLALFPLVPLATPAAKQAPTSKEAPATSPAESPMPGDAQAENGVDGSADALLKCLQDQMDTIQQTIDDLKARGATDEPSPAQDPKLRESSKAELGEWVPRMFESHGYTAWPQHLEGIKAVFINAFPPLPTGASRYDKLVKVVEIFENQITLAEKQRAFYDDAEHLSMAASL